MGSVKMLNALKNVLTNWENAKDAKVKRLKMPEMTTENILRATYALYNGGNITNILRPWNPHAPSDKKEIDDEFKKIIVEMK